MRLPRYPYYKNSGVDWFGHVPNHWEVCALKRIARLQSGESITAERIEETGDYPVYGGNGVRGYTTGFTHEGQFAVIGRQGALCGNVNYATGRFWASEHAVVALPLQPVETIWLGETLRTMNLNQYSVSAAQPGLSVELVARLAIPLPPLPEQTSIALFLKSETAKIDGLMAEQRRLMALLKEKRQAVISHAVTKGLNLDAPVKPSGVDWCGDVPAHWQVTPVRRLGCFIQTGPFGSQLHSHEYVVGGTPVVNPMHMIDGRITPSDASTVPPSVVDRLSHQRLKTGDILVARRGDLGRAALVTRREEGWLCGTGSMILRFDQNYHDPAYVLRYLSLPGIRQLFESFSIGATMDSISPPTVFGMPLLVPSLQEQREIVAFINSHSERFETLTSEAKQAIELLQERRATLISTAVTGQIDVRSFAEAQPA